MTAPPFSRSDRLALPCAVALCLAALAVLSWRFVDGLDFLSFMDEAAHLVAGRMLDRGGVLYRDFVDSHGPLIFAMAQGYGAVFGWSHDNGARAMIVGCGVLAMLSLAASPIPHTQLARTLGLFVGAALLASLWLRQGLYLVSFYPVGGALAAIALGGFVAGACFNRFPGVAHAFAAGLATALLVGTAYSFLPCLAAFVVAACWAAVAAGQQRALLGFGVGSAAGAAAMACYMLRFADLHGYLSYHLAENQTVYSRYIGFGWWMFRHGLVPSGLPGDRARTVGIVCLLVCVPALLFPGTRRGPLLLVMLGVLSLNARGADDFQNGSFLWASVALLASVAMRAIDIAPPSVRRSAPLACALLVLVEAWFLAGALYRPFGMTAQTVLKLPRWPIGDRSDAPLFAAIRHYARPDERILGLLYQPQLYLLADRLPMDGFYAWFPWDADYVRVARFGRGRDLCRALLDRPPPVIVLDPAPFWNHLPFQVITCLPDILRTRYVADMTVSDLHGTLFVRRDRL